MNMAMGADTTSNHVIFEKGTTEAQPNQLGGPKFMKIKPSKNQRLILLGDYICLQGQLFA